LKHTTTKGKNNKESKMTNSNNTKGFTLIELIMVTIILGILAAVAIPRYMTSITKAEEAAEDAVISSIRAGLETYATEELMKDGRPEHPVNPFEGLGTKPAGYTTDATDANVDGEWTYNTTNTAITHMRNDNTVHHWDYNEGIHTAGAEALDTTPIGPRVAGASVVS
jgi:prepilin-type N-terminal cleavage/methylation domain-containing protein